MMEMSPYLRKERKIDDMQFPVTAEPMFIGCMDEDHLSGFEMALLAVDEMPALSFLNPEKLVEIVRVQCSGLVFQNAVMSKGTVISLRQLVEA